MQEHLSVPRHQYNPSWHSTELPARSIPETGKMNYSQSTARKTESQSSSVTGPEAARSLQGSKVKD